MEFPPRQGSWKIDPELLARVATGDQQAFAELYDWSSSLLFTLALRILGDREEAAEVLQEVYLEVWRKVVRYNPARGSPTAWLVTMTRSRALDRLRSRAARGYGMTDSIQNRPLADLPDGNPSPLQASADLELRALVEKALVELPEAQREALELAYYQGLSHTEIAARLNEPLGTVKTRIQLGMSKLRAALRSCWDQG